MIICQLIEDCLFEIFDYLTFKDLVSLGGTCKLMRKLVCNALQKDYAARISKFRFNCHGEPQNEYTYNKWFSGFIKRVHVDNVTLQHLRFIGSSFDMLNAIVFFKSKLSAKGVEYIKPKLSTIETIELVDCEYDGDLYNGLLKLCVNLKNLHIKAPFLTNINTNIIPGIGNEWLLHNYSMLEELELNLTSQKPIEELNTFFERNPKIRMLSITSFCLKFNIGSIKAANLSLETLQIIHSTDFDDVIPGDEIFDLLNNLQGAYKELHFHVYGDISQPKIGWLASLPLLEKLAICSRSEICGYTLSKLINLKHLVFRGNSKHRFSNTNAVAMSLVNLERIEFGEASINEIIPFIKNSRELKSIHIEHFKVMDKNQLLLDMLNRERLKLNRVEPGKAACKTVIYVNEQIYSKIKWASGNNTNLTFIQVKRK